MSLFAVKNAILIPFCFRDAAKIEVRVLDKLQQKDPTGEKWVLSEVKVNYIVCPTNSDPKKPASWRYGCPQ